MFAKNLEMTLALLAEKGDVLGTLPAADIAERFEVLRGCRKLPYGRDKRAQPLTNGEVAAAILGLAAGSPKWAGNAAIVLGNLQPVGGAAASYLGAATLQGAVERLVADAAARKSFVRLAVSGAESGTNSHGYAAVTYEADGLRRYAFYVPREAASRLQPGAERDYDPEFRNAPLSRETSFNRAFFERVARDVELAKLTPAPAGDGSEYDAEEARQERDRKLGVRPGSRFLNIGVDNQVTWPQGETVVKFDRYQFVLMPKTSDHVQSIHADLTLNQLTDSEAITAINRFLSIMTWCDDAFAIAQGSWSGSSVPVAVPRRNLAFTTAHHWFFDRRIPASEAERRAIALYREARNAQQNFMVSYAVLNFYKVIEIGYHGKEKVRNWFRDKYELLKNQPVHADIFTRFAKICGRETT
jgi:hypothetical protein